mmetsp:Transcript_25641/g.55834  ORF Transcript_25641/g.55834 Transcript_25641/m.55834 type:complete len:218 (-) Transcript_25641:647-1300(-)|eukprot:CAMPEP_0202891542 /NCGR_PEP_ID=MMETSP1392-20130828/1576_1 /ASSEMBLY_ACC=CAM_ASM_000868 /TAXON_ID=225041 /ORGANISM="Chlamydomonas chlamydogama, Strain SAG 11-48b" /LENGTH=217 /DNA_ID=CAMNT_0049575327 /DNA_START=147 /DNA_END=800 /DNA_ORIENTATION=-
MSAVRFASNVPLISKDRRCNFAPTFKNVIAAAPLSAPSRRPLPVSAVTSSATASTAASAPSTSTALVAVSGLNKPDTALLKMVLMEHALGCRENAFAHVSSSSSSSSSSSRTAAPSCKKGSTTLRTSTRRSVTTRATHCAAPSTSGHELAHVASFSYYSATASASYDAASSSAVRSAKLAVPQAAAAGSQESGRPGAQPTMARQTMRSAYREPCIYM